MKISTENAQFIPRHARIWAARFWESLWARHFGKCCGDSLDAFKSMSQDVFIGCVMI